MEESTRNLLIGLGAPGAIGLALGLAALRPGPPPGARKLSASETLAWMDKPVRIGALGAIAGILAIALGWYVSQMGIYPEARWPSISIDDRLRIVAGALGAIGLLAALIHRGGAAGDSWAAVWAAVIGGIGTVIVLWPKLGASGEWSVWERAAAVCAFSLWAATTAWPLTRMLKHGQRVSAGVILTGLAAAVGAGLLGTGSVKLGWFGFGFAAPLVGLLIVILIRRGTAIGGSAIALATGVLASLVCAGCFFSDTPAWVAILLGLVPAAGWVADGLLARSLGPGPRTVVRLLVPVAIAIAAIAPGLIQLGKFAAGAE